MSDREIKPHSQGAYVRPPVQRSMTEPVDYMAEEEGESEYSHDTLFTTKRPSPFSQSSYKRSRKQVEQMQENSRYGQYLSVPKGSHDLFGSPNKTRSRKAVFILAIIAVVLVIALICVLIAL